MKKFAMERMSLNNLFRKPSTRLYPDAPKKYFPNTRGRLVFNLSDCTFCTLCQKKCPTHAITVRREQQEWELERMRCIACGNCCDLCRKGCLTMKNELTKAVILPEREYYRREKPQSSGEDAVK